MKEDYCMQLESGALRFERTLPGPIERVWEHLVDPEKRAKWFCGGTMGEQPGDIFSLHFDHDNISPEERPENAGPGGTQMDATIIAIRPPNLLVMAWGPEAEETRFELSADGQQVKLVLIQNPPDNLSTVISMAAGWHAHIGILMDHLRGETHRGFWSEHQTAEDHYQEVVKPVQ